jgi:hypothetical protein
MRRLSRRFVGLLLVTALALTLGRRPGDAAEPPPADDAPPFVEYHGPSPVAIEVRLRAKRAIALDVAAGRRRLVEAAALFGALNRQPPALTEPPVEVYRNKFVPIPARTAEERLCWQVACWVHNEHYRSRRMTRVSAVLRRLAAEFEEELRTRGQIRLPELSTLEPVEEVLRRAEAEANERRAGAAHSQTADGPLVDDVGSRAD